MTKSNEKLSISCFRCGTELICGAVNGDATCWCDALPNIMPLNEEATSCYCRDCLAKVMETTKMLNSSNIVEHKKEP